ncbi:MAG: hypothetical protein H7831_18885, partial [Magnetococcus sp. WYHC-3]
MRLPLPTWLLLLLCLPSACTLGPAPHMDAQSAPTPTIEALSATALPTADGVLVVLQSPDGIGNFRLEQSPAGDRVLVHLPQRRFAPWVQPQELDLPPLRGLFPMNDAQGGGQLELAVRGPVDAVVRPGENQLAVEIRPGTMPPGATAPRLLALRWEDSPLGTRLMLEGQGSPPTATVTTLQDPSRSVLELPGVSMDLQAQLPGYGVRVTQVHSLTTAGGARLELFHPHGGVHAKVEPPATATAWPSLLLTSEDPDTGLTPADGMESPTLLRIHHRRDGAAHLLDIDLSQGGIAPATRRVGDDWVVDFPGVRLPAALAHHYDLTDFAGALRAYDLFSQGGQSRLVAHLQPDQPVATEVQPRDQGLTLRMTPQPRAEPTADSGKPVFSGERVNMDFKDIEIQNALRLISDMSHMNLIMSDSVTGTLTMRLEDVPIDQALSLILDTKGLGMLVQGNVVWVAPKAEIKDAVTQREQERALAEDRSPLVTDMIPINFAAPASVADLVRSTPDKGGMNLLSPRGSLALDPRTATLIVKDSPSRLARIRELVSALDKPIPQVLIEARIVEMERGLSENLGINWGLEYQPTRDPTNSGIQNGLWGSTQVDTPAGATNGLVDVRFGSLSPAVNLSLTLGALENLGRSKTISSPRVLTINNQAARINQGVNQPYPIVNTDGTRTYAWT